MATCMIPAHDPLTSDELVMVSSLRHQPWLAYDLLESPAGDRSWARWHTLDVDAAGYLHIECDPDADAHPTGLEWAADRLRDYARTRLATESGERILRYTLQNVILHAATDRLRDGGRIEEHEAQTIAVIYAERGDVIPDDVMDAMRDDWPALLPAAIDDDDDERTRS